MCDGHCAGIIGPGQSPAAQRSILRSGEPMAISNDDRLAVAEPTVASFLTRSTSHVADALRYWEPRRLTYNAVLAAVVAGHVLAYWPHSRAVLSFDVILSLFVLAVLANIAYCAVYVVDLFVQYSGLRKEWMSGRVALLVVGTAFAAVIAHFFSSGIFGGGVN